MTAVSLLFAIFMIAAFASSTIDAALTTEYRTLRTGA